MDGRYVATEADPLQGKRLIRRLIFPQHRQRIMGSPPIDAIIAIITVGSPHYGVDSDIRCKNRP
jgi:hypothetical protein